MTQRMFVPWIPWVDYAGSLGGQGIMQHPSRAPQDHAGSLGAPQGSCSIPGGPPGIMQDPWGGPRDHAASQGSLGLIFHKFSLGFTGSFGVPMVQVGSSDLVCWDPRPARVALRIPVQIRGGRRKYVCIYVRRNKTTLRPRVAL